MDFYEFLRTKHALKYTGTDDAMPEAFDTWLEELSVDEWIAYGHLYAQAYVEGANSMR